MEEKVMQGKLYVRFGEVDGAASATPRCWSALYKRLIVFLGMAAYSPLLRADLAPKGGTVVLRGVGLVMTPIVLGIVAFTLFPRKKLLPKLLLTFGGTVLAVLLLPLLDRPVVRRGDYTAEGIPAIAGIRTKIGLYQYENGKLPCIWDGTTNGPLVETWMSLGGDDGRYTMGYAKFSRDKPPLRPEKLLWFGSPCDVDCRDLTGKYSRPNHYQYLVMLNEGTNYAYFVGCFGDGNGLGLGTGFAVCEIAAKGHKYIGTWRRDKSNGEVQACFTSNTLGPDGHDFGGRFTLGCFVPDKASFDNMAEVEGHLDVIYTMARYGWEFDVDLPSLGHSIMDSRKTQFSHDSVEVLDENTIKKLHE